MAKSTDKQMGSFVKKYRAGEASAAERPGATEFTLEGETAPVTMTSRKRAADNAAGVNKPRANPAGPVPGVGGIPFEVDTSSPPEPPVQGNRMPATSKQARKKGRENVLTQRAKKAVADDRKAKADAAAAAAASNPAIPAPTPGGGSGGSAASGGSGKKERRSAKELAARAQAQANREARQKAKAEAKSALIVSQNRKASELLGEADPTTRKTTKLNRKVTRAQETLGMIGHPNVDKAEVRSPDRKTPYGRPLQVRTTPEEQAAIDSKVARAKSPETRAKYKEREGALERRNQRDRKTLVDAGLADTSVIGNEREKLESGLKAMRVAADPRSDLAGVSGAELRSMQQEAAARAGLRQLMSPELNKAPSIAKTEGEGMLGGLHLRIRNSSDIPRVKPNPVSVEHEILPVQENGLRKEGVAKRYGDQQARKRKIKAVIQHNETATEDKQKTVPTPLSGRTDKAPVPIEHLPSEWSVETSRVPQKGGKKAGVPASIPTASGSDVVHYTVPDPMEALAALSGNMNPSPAAIRQLQTATALRAGGAHNVKTQLRQAGGIRAKGSFTGESVAMPDNNALVTAKAESERRNRSDLVATDIARVARNDKFTGEERATWVPSELKSGFNEFPASRRRAFEALQTAGMDSYGNTRGSSQNRNLGQNAKMVFGAMAASSNPKEIGAQVAASLPKRDQSGSSTAKIQRRGQYTTELG